MRRADRHGVGRDRISAATGAAGPGVVTRPRRRRPRHELIDHASHPAGHHVEQRADHAVAAELESSGASRSRRRSKTRKSSGPALDDRIAMRRASAGFLDPDDVGDVAAGRSSSRQHVDRRATRRHVVQDAGHVDRGGDGFEMAVHALLGGLVVVRHRRAACRRRRSSRPPSRLRRSRLCCSCSVPARIEASLPTASMTAAVQLRFSSWSGLAPRPSCR